MKREERRATFFFFFPRNVDKLILDFGKIWRFFFFIYLSETLNKTGSNFQSRNVRKDGFRTDEISPGGGLTGNIFSLSICRNNSLDIY